MRGGVSDLRDANELAHADGVNVEKQQEQLLMNKLAANGRLPAKPQSAFLQKKLQQQRKFFDSGDYAMNKDKAKKPSTDQTPSVLLNHGQGQKLSSINEKRDDRLSVEVAPALDESLLIPRPDTVPQRKSSIIYPAVHSKLSPQLHIHHASSHDDPSMDP